MIIHLLLIGLLILCLVGAFIIEIKVRKMPTTYSEDYRFQNLMENLKKGVAKLEKTRVKKSSKIKANKRGSHARKTRK